MPRIGGGSAAAARAPGAFGIQNAASSAREPLDENSADKPGAGVGEVTTSSGSTCSPGLTHQTAASVLGADLCLFRHYQGLYAQPTSRFFRHLA
jgi:hypothetical protein